MLAEMAVGLIFSRNSEGLFHLAPASALQCLLGAPPGSALPSPALPCFIPVTSSSPLSPGWSPSWHSAPAAPKQSRSLALKGHHNKQSGAGSGCLGSQGRDSGSWDDNCSEMLCLKPAKNHSTHLCSCSTPGMSGAESLLPGGSALPDPTLFLPNMQEWSDGQSCPFLLSRPF